MWSWLYSVRDSRGGICEWFEVVCINFGMLSSLVIPQVRTLVLQFCDGIWSQPGALQFPPFPLLHADVLPQNPLANSKGRPASYFLTFALFFKNVELNHGIQSLFQDNA